jgi:hypothetical protein
MQTIYNRHNFISIAKQGGVMPSCWYAIEINSLSLDRTPRVGSMEGSV